VTRALEILAALEENRAYIEDARITAHEANVKTKLANANAGKVQNWRHP
jgi:hypothetical protein